jgi:hypothetical protein
MSSSDIDAAIATLPAKKANAATWAQLIAFGMTFVAVFAAISLELPYLWNAGTILAIIGVYFKLVEQEG